MITYIIDFRNQEHEHIPEPNGSLASVGVRITKTSEDHYARSDSSSSRSTIDGPISSPRSNIYNSSTTHQQMVKPDYKRVFILLVLLFHEYIYILISYFKLLYPAPKAQSLIDTRIQGQSMKKSTVQHKHTTKTKATHANQHYTHRNQHQPYYSSLSTIGPDGLPQHHSPTNMMPTKNGQMPFLPRISGASAFSNYSSNNGHSALMTNKVKQIK